MDNASLRQLYRVVDKFEQLLSSYTGAPYVICVDSCTSALQLCFLYDSGDSVTIPNNTYVGVAMAAIAANKKISFIDREWTGLYQITPTNIYDSAKRFTSNMYLPGTNMCLSFHYKKHLKIGRGGAILTDNSDAAQWFKLVRNCGKDVNIPLYNQQFNVLGFNMLLHPELAEKGITLLEGMQQFNSDMPYEYYGNLSEQMKGILE
jgi:dTDP-4-amino-4,6-dideoxygalactose transaminase